MTALNVPILKTMVGQKNDILPLDCIEYSVIFWFIL